MIYMNETLRPPQSPREQLTTSLSQFIENGQVEAIGCYGGELLSPQVYEYANRVAESFDNPVRGLITRLKIIKYALSFAFNDVHQTLNAARDEFGRIGFAKAYQLMENKKHVPTSSDETILGIFRELTDNGMPDNLTKAAPFLYRFTMDMLMSDCVTPVAQIKDDVGTLPPDNLTQIPFTETMLANLGLADPIKQGNKVYIRVVDFNAKNEDNADYSFLQHPNTIVSFTTRGVMRIFTGFDSDSNFEILKITRSGESEKIPPDHFTKEVSMLKQFMQVDR